MCMGALVSKRHERQIVASASLIGRKRSRNCTWMDVDGRLSARALVASTAAPVRSLHSTWLHYCVLSAHGYLGFRLLTLITDQLCSSPCWLEF